MSGRFRMILLLIVLEATLGCQREATPPKAVESKSLTTTKVYTLKGIVRKVDASSGVVSIAHDEIPGFMAKMTMPFTMRDKTTLAMVHPGDEVEGPLEVTFEKGEVTQVDLADLKVIRAAPPSTPTFPTEPNAQEILKPGDAVPDFQVTTQEGKPLRLSDLKGEVVVLTFIYTRCPIPEFCPAMDAKFADLARRIAASPARASKVRLLSVSFDPEHDTPEVLAAHAARRGAKPPLWSFAVASHEELARVAGPLGLAYSPATQEIGHNLRTAVIDPEGKLARLEPGPGWSPVDVLKTVISLIPKAPHE